MRPRGVPTLAGQPYADRSAEAVIAPTRSPTCPTAVRGSQCKREDPLDAVDATAVDDGPGPAARRLLGRLEQQPDPSWQIAVAGEVGEHEAGAEHRRRVHVVAAGVADAVAPSSA